MELLLEIRESDVGLKNIESFTMPYTLRKAARAIIFNTNGEIAIMHVTKDNYHKLPGGGVEEGEDLFEALKREALEEAGSKIEIEKPLGIIIEYRNEIKRLQISYCYIANVKGDIQNPMFTTEELSGGFELLWVQPEEAIHLLETDKPTSYDGKFIQQRDKKFLKSMAL